MSMDIILIRHGETEENRLGIASGQTPGVLSNEGKKQAQRVAKQLKDKHFAAIYSSDLQRCVDTAHLIAAYHEDIPFVLSPALREIKLGRLEGVRFFKKPLRFMSLGARLAMALHMKMPGGESWPDLKNRVSIFLNEIYKKHPEQTVMIVSHGTTIRAIKSVVEDISVKDFLSEEVPNCAILHMTMRKSV